VGKAGGPAANKGMLRNKPANTIIQTEVRRFFIILTIRTACFLSILLSKQGAVF
jgi:hypothetical protein